MPESYDLHPVGDGYWQCVASGISGGFHYCDFYVDGVRTINTLAPVGYGGFRPVNYFEMPGDPDAEFYLLQNVPHGTVHMASEDENARNTYENPNAILPKADPDTRCEKGIVTATLPKLSWNMQIRLLEQELGCTLFERGSRKIRLTEEGATLYGHGCTWKAAFPIRTVPATRTCPVHRRRTGENN